ncbi:MAG: hydroxymethylglutaryl-CoA reductase [Thermoanaerobaculales bacterium]|nr:hydroxymethylglutaryl-CoA reductase [Thermoanaerobaculales bacterium]
MKIPSLILKQLYTFGSLENHAGGARFGLKNRLSDAVVTRVRAIKIDGAALPLGAVRFELGADGEVAPEAITPETPVTFPLAKLMTVSWRGAALEVGKHTIDIDFETTPFGRLSFQVKDAIREGRDERISVPYDKEDNYSDEIIRARRDFITSFAGAKPEHLFAQSFDPRLTQGNIENYVGVAQVPIGLAGPITVKGEHAKGDFVVPLATTEGTLVASYNRGMKVLNLSGGVTATVSDDRMQRAPVFVFDSARQARDFRDWVAQNTDEIRRAAEATSSVAKLLDIDIFLANKFAYLRFNYATGDAAGQNMVGRATFAACSWMLDNLDNVRSFYLESNLATDKKHSQINIMRTRGKRVTAEAVIPKDILVQHMRVEPRSLHYHAQVSNVGAFISGANNNGAHSPNGITAMFIATGQDVANVAESCSGIIYTELTPAEDLYISLTIPSLIVATYGGGVGLPTQRECLEMLGCWGKGKVRKLAEIVGAVALAGEISLASAISSLDWVSSHEKYGRNR